jgi:hypothetical protein
MSLTFWLGLGVVGVSALILGPMIFSGDSEPATAAAASDVGSGANDGGSRRTVEVIRVGDSVGLHPTWAERARGVVGLLFVSAGIGAGLAVAVGLVVLFLGVALLH